MWAPIWFRRRPLRGIFVALDWALALKSAGPGAIGVAMDKDSVIRTLREHEAELRAEGISHVCLFGSVARGEAGEKSDVDLFYDYDPERFGFLQFMRVRERAPEIVGQAVDIMPRESIHPLIRSAVERAAVEVF
jgi:predicted nucleotidyltransferase